MNPNQTGQDEFSEKYDNKKDDPIIPNQNPNDVLFKVPAQQVFPVLGSVMSILSLMLMSGLTIYIFTQLKEQATWVKLPFMFTIFGATLGWVFELGLLLSGNPFQPNVNRFTRFIQSIRLLNIGPVVTTLFFFACQMTIADPTVRMAFLYLVVFSCFGFATALFWGGVFSLPLMILGTQVFQLVIVLAYGAHTVPCLVLILLAAQTAIQLGAFVVGTATPMKSTGFHVLSTISGVLAYIAFDIVIKGNPDFSMQVAPVIPAGSLHMWGLIIASFGGIVYTMKASSPTYNIFRSWLSNIIWSAQYFLLISAKRFPKPYNLSELYKNGAPAPATLQPYYLQHEQYLPEKLIIPAVIKIEGNVTAFNTLIAKAKGAFKLIALLDHFFPQADINVPLREKPRMDVWSYGLDVYPPIYLRKIFGFTLPIPQLKVTPPPAIDAFKEGQLLAYLAESGIANPFLKPSTDPARKGTLVIDLTFLDKYETKPDYESYGGMAFFKVNSHTQKLELTSVIGPNSGQELKVNTYDPQFQRAERMIVASLYFYVISGRHLAGIHMIYNMVEVALHNAFDAQGQFTHPIRTFMYLHLFSHELAEELTTEHLLQEGAVFTQVFATTYDSLIDHLNDSYHAFEYGDDENFELRKEIMTMDNGELLPKCAIKWEMEYALIWQKYTNELINIIYADDAEVQADKYLQDLHLGLTEIIFKPLPPRYEGFKTKAGVSRWASDTIHHLVVRHQVYGTSGIRAAMDPRISTTQVPKDAGTPGVDEWRSLLGVGLATACARFTLLVGKDGENFTYLLGGVNEKYKPGMTKVFEQLQHDLVALEREWTKNSEEEEFNYNYFRATPSDMRTGPGY